jgi:hypothetical protein
MIVTLEMPTDHHAALRPFGRLEPDPWEINPERKSYEEQLFKPDKKLECTDILVSEKAPPHELTISKIY